MNNKFQKNLRKFCFVTDGFIADPAATITGPMVQTYIIGKELSNRNWEVHYVAYNKSGMHGYMMHEGLHVHWIKARRYLPMLSLPSVWMALIRINPDVLYQRGRDILTGLMALYGLMYGKRTLWASAGETGVERKKYASQQNRQKGNFIRRWVLQIEALINDTICNFGMRRTDQMIVQTAYQQQRLLVTYARSSTIIKSGHPLPPPVQRALPIKVLWISSIKPVKRVDLFLDLADMCKNEPIEFWIAGQIVHEETGHKMQERIAKMNNIRYLGAVPFEQSSALIASSHILVNTTEIGYEGLPNAFVQAWLAGTVTLSLHTDPDAVIMKNDLGYVNPGLVHLKETILRFIFEFAVWHRQSNACRQYAEENYSVVSIVNQIEKTL